MTQKRHLYKSSPFVASASSRKRGRKKSNKAALASPKNKLLISRNKGSWFPNTSNEEIENQIETPSSSSSCSSSHKKLVLWKEVRRESQYEVSDRCHWVIDMNILETYIKDVAVCKECSSELSLDEMVEYRMGLGTRFRFSCKNVDCSSHINNHGFSTTNKKGKMYEINRKSVLAGRIVGKGRSGIEKICSVLGPASPINKSSFAEHTVYLQNQAFEMRLENLQKAAKKAKQQICVQSELSNDEIVDIPTCFDGSWNSRGWLAKKGFASAIAENTSQVIDIVFKNSTCRTCDERFC